DTLITARRCDGTARDDRRDVRALAVLIVDVIAVLVRREQGIRARILPRKNHVVLSKHARIPTRSGLLQRPLLVPQTRVEYCDRHASAGDAAGMHGRRADLGWVVR